MENQALKQRKDSEITSNAETIKQDNVKPKHQISPQPKPAPKTDIKRPKNREDRLADLRAKSAATAQFAKDAKDVVEKKKALDIKREAQLETQNLTTYEELEEKINVEREKELALLQRLAWTHAFGFVMILRSVPLILPLVVFPLASNLGVTITASKAFTTIALFSILRLPFSMFNSDALTK